MRAGRKDDRLDAKTLARLARIDPELLAPIRHRGQQAQADLTRIRARAVLVEMRTAIINAARGLTESTAAASLSRLNPTGFGLSAE